MVAPCHRVHGVPRRAKTANGDHFGRQIVLIATNRSANGIAIALNEGKELRARFPAPAFDYLE